MNNGDVKKFISKVEYSCTHVSMGELYLNIMDDTILTTYQDGKQLIYKYNNDTRLYQKISHDKFRSMICSTLIPIIKMYLDSAHNALGRTGGAENKSSRTKLKSKYTNLKKIYENACNIPYCNNIVDAIFYDKKIYDDNLIEKLDNIHHVVNFKNGLFDLKTGLFRKRKKHDIFTKTLDYDYVPFDDFTDEMNDAYENLTEAFYMICNNDWNQCETYKKWLGYCMTEHTSEQKSFWSIGKRASEGKSTIIEAFDSMFHIYSHKLNYETFNKSYQKRHKQFAELKGVRFAWLEEINREKLDIQSLKDCIGADKVGGNEILYGTSEDIKINFKLMFISNNNPKFTNDNGMKRRGLCMIHKNRFVSQKEFDNAKDKENIYVKDVTFKNKIKTDEYKIALFNLLFPYAISFYESKCIECGKIPIIDNEPCTNEKKCEYCTGYEIFINNWENICCENDKMMQFLEIHYEITENKDDIIYKDDFLQEYREFYKLKNLTWNTLLADINRVGLIYDRQKKKTFIVEDKWNENINKVTKRGFVLGIKKIELQEDKIFEEETPKII